MSQTLAKTAAEDRDTAIQTAGLRDESSDHPMSPAAAKFPSIESVLAAFDRSAPLINAA